MLKIPRGKIACVPIFDRLDSGIKGYDDAEAALGFQKPKSGNIITLDQYRERCDQGIVKYVGGGVSKKEDGTVISLGEEFGFKIGDHIIFSGYTGELVNFEGEGLFIIFPAKFVTATVFTEPTEIPGLFFQDGTGSREKDHGKVSIARMEELILKAGGRTRIRPEDGHTIEILEEPEYFPATYEMAMQLIAEAMTPLKIKKDRPKLEDYDDRNL